MKLKLLSLCSGGGLMDYGLEKAGFECVGQVEIMPYALKVLKKHFPKVPKHTDILTLFRSASLVRTYQTPTQKEKVLKGKEVLSSLNVCELSKSLSRLGFSLRMFPDSFQFTKEGILRLSCKRFPKAGMGIRGEFWTVNTSESPNDAKESSLLDVLEKNVHPKYYLSHKAVAGMIRRSKKWGRGGYVFLLKMEKNKTRQLKHLSLQQLEQALIPTQTMEHTSSQKELKKVCIRVSGQEENLEIEYKDMSPKQSVQHQEETLPLYGRTLILRKLTPVEKERLQGLSDNWTLVGE